jgi:hypothetical protein
MAVEIRKMMPQDHEAIWTIIQEVISKGDTYAFDPNTPQTQMLDSWQSL